MAARNIDPARFAQHFLDAQPDMVGRTGAGSSLLKLFCHISNVLIDGGQTVQPMAAQMRKFANSNIRLVAVAGLIGELCPRAARALIGFQ